MGVRTCTAAGAKRAQPGSPCTGLREGGHDSEDHGSHGGAGVDVSAAEVQDAEVYLLSSTFIGQGVAFVQCVEGFVELGRA